MGQAQVSDLKAVVGIANAGMYPEMLAKNYFADIMGINLEYALEAYDWQDWCPMTDNGITVSGFWDKSKGIRRLRRFSQIIEGRKEHRSGGV